MRHEEVGAVLLAKLTTQGGAYSPTNARYDYLTLNHFADMSGSDGTGMTLSNADAYFMRLGNSTIDIAGHHDTAALGARRRIAPSVQPDRQPGRGLVLPAALRAPVARRLRPASRRCASRSSTRTRLSAASVSGGTAYPATSYSYLIDLRSERPALVVEARRGGDRRRRHRASLEPHRRPPKPFSISLSEPIARAKSVTHIETDRGDATVAGRKP